MSRLLLKPTAGGLPELPSLLFAVALLCSAPSAPGADMSADADAATGEQIIPAAPAAAEEFGLPGPLEGISAGSPIEPYEPLLQAGSEERSFTVLPGPAEAPEALPPFRLESVFLMATGDLAPPRRLSIREVVAMALENNVEIKVQRLQPELGQQQIRFARGAFDPQFSFSTQYSYSETPQNAVEFVSTGGLTAGFDDPRTFVSENFFMNWQLGGKTPLGTQYSFGLNQLQARNDINIQTPPSIFFPEYTSVLGLTLTQPLLKGAGTAVNLAELRVARVQKQIGWYDWQQQLINSLSRSIALYLDLLFASENLRVREGAVQTARLLEEQNIRRVRAGKMRPSDVWEAQTSVANNADIALRASNIFLEAQNNLKAQIFSAAQVVSGPTGRLEPDDDLRVPPLAMDRSRFLLEAFAKRPEYLKLQSELEKEGIKVRYARNQIYPQVDLQASYGLTGLEGTFNNSFNEAFGGQGPAFAFGVLFSVPLGNDKELASLQSAKIKQEQAVLALDRATIDLTLDVDTAMGLVETTRKQVEVAALTTRSAKLTVEAQEKLLEEGKATTFDVVRLQNDFADASTRELAALANYRKAVLRLSVSRGTLLEELGVSLEDESETAFPAVERNSSGPMAGTGPPPHQGDESLPGATSASGHLPAKPQSISFAPLPVRPVGGRPVVLNAAAQSRGPVEFRSSNPRVAVVDERRLAIVGAGTTTITARQGGSEEWMPVEASQVFTVTRAPQKISFPAPRLPRFAPGRTFELEARASSGGPVRFTAEPAGIVSISGSVVTMLQAGRVTITALQAGTKDFEATETSRSLKLR
jgi:outer membrane protein